MWYLACRHPAAVSSTSATALVFDHGGRRIGIALASRNPRLASPLTTLAARGGVPDWPDVEKLIREWCPGCLVVGVPYNEPGRRINSGGNSETTDSESAAERFAAELESRYPMPVIRVATSRGNSCPPPTTRRRCWPNCAGARAGRRQP